MLNKNINFYSDSGLHLHSFVNLVISVRHNLTSLSGIFKVGRTP